MFPSLRAASLWLLARTIRLSPAPLIPAYESDVIRGVRRRHGSFKRPSSSTLTSSLKRLKDTDMKKALHRVPLFFALDPVPEVPPLQPRPVRAGQELVVYGSSTLTRRFGGRVFSRRRRTTISKWYRDHGFKIPADGPDFFDFDQKPAPPLFFQNQGHDHPYTCRSELNQEERGLERSMSSKYPRQFRSGTELTGLVFPPASSQMAVPWPDLDRPGLPVQKCRVLSACGP